MSNRIESTIATKYIYNLYNNCALWLKELKHESICPNNDTEVSYLEILTSKT